MAMYFAQDGNYGDASGLVIIDDNNLSPDLTIELDEIGDIGDEDRYEWAVSVATGERQ